MTPKQKLFGFFLTILLACSACSTQKNTWATRFFHSTTTQYNVHFNGKESYNKGIEKITENNVDDFAKVLPMFPISNAENASVATSEMKRTIEKCRKSIKLHSIKKKPQKNYKKSRDPEYIAFYEQNEFNNVLDEVWILLAKAEFHKGQFLESIGTFMYVAKHYKNDKDIVAQCQLWITRAYAEMGWIYEAEDALLKIKQDELRRDNSQLYAIVNADLLLKKQQFKDAIPFLQLAEKNETNRTLKMRFNFILGQLHQINGDNEAANQAYTKVVKSNPPFEMDFNARINQIQLTDNDEKALKTLHKMTKQYKFKDNLDQIYGAIGNIYLQQKDTTNAIENYHLAIENSTKNGNEKAVVLITLGDLYYEANSYNASQPCYDDAIKIIPTTDENYERVNKRAETLNELIKHYDIVQLQDSLLHLSTLSEKEQLKIAEKIIADLEESERLAAEKAHSDAENEGGLQGVNTQNMIGGNGNSKWYFYNVNLIRNGKSEFAKKWGRRKLEDNWRLSNKTMVSTILDENLSPIETNDTTQEVNVTQINDVKNPVFYLQQIPKTQEQIDYANSEIAKALYNMGMVYKEKIEDAELATATFDELERRYPNDEHMVEIYYLRHLIALQQGDVLNAEEYRKELLRKFPDSKQAETLQYPDYAQRLKNMEAEQDSIYQTTYQAYLNSDFNTVFKNKIAIEERFPLSPLLPKFYFLNALSVAKTQNSEAFANELNVMVEKYPESDVSAMAKDMLALMNQGAESKKGATHGTLIAKRTEEADQQQDENLGVKAFSTERNTPSVCLMIIEKDEKKRNELMYQVALFNFSKFLIKEFDLSTMPWGENQIALRISNFSNYDETAWYEKLTRKDTALNLTLNEMGVEIIRISEENMKLLNTVFTVEEYELFQLQELK